MKLALSDDEAAFRDELREFFTTQIPADIRERAREGELRFPDDVVTAQRILNAHGLAVPNWPVEWGGKDWTPLQRQIWSDEMRLACVPEPLAFNASMVGPVIARFGSQELKERFLPADRQPRHLVVPGLLRAGGRFGPGVAAHHRGPRRRLLRHQRPEDVDHAGPVRGLDLPARPHRPERAQAAGGHLVPAGRDVDAGHHAAPDQADRRRLRGQRGLLRRRPRARRSAGRRGEQRLDLRQVPAEQRAHRHRPDRDHEGVAGPGQGARREDGDRARERCWTIRCSPPASPRSRTSCWRWSSPSCGSAGPRPTASPTRRRRSSS